LVFFENFISEGGAFETFGSERFAFEIFDTEQPKKYEG
jgi:hypothetical protein